MSTRQTFCRVTIITPDLSWDGRPSRTLQWTGQPGGALDGLMSVSVQTSIHLGANGFSLQFAPRNFERESIADRVPTNSLVYINMGSSAHDEDPTVLVGLSSEPTEVEVFTPGGPQRMITIPGRGLDSVLAEAGIYRNSALAGKGPAFLEQLAKNLQRVTGPSEDAELTGGKIASWMGQLWFAGIDPREAIAKVLYYFVSSEETTIIDMGLPGMRSLGDLLTVGGQTPRDPEVAAWVKKFSAAVEEAKRSGADQAKNMADAVKFACPIPEKWTLLTAGLALPVSNVNPAAGSILDIIHGAADPLFHELFAVHRDGRVEIMFGAKPFIDSEQEGPGTLGTQFNVERILEEEIETIQITTGDLVGQQSMRRGLPVSNLWHVLPGAGMANNATALRNLIMPEVSGQLNYSDFNRFGLRPKETTMPYMPGDFFGITADVAKAAQVKINDTMDLVVFLNRTLKAWEDPHPFMWAGSLTVNGRAAFKPGIRLLWKGEDVNGRPDGRGLREFYVEGAHHTYQFANGAYNTQLQVTRGWQLSEG